MVSLTALWLPILLSAVVVFVASSIIHMALPWHSKDLKKFPAEDAMLDAVRLFNLGPGEYVAPLPESMKHMGTPEFQAKVKRGPRIMMKVLPPQKSIARNLAVWFIYSIVIGVFAAYVASFTLGVFRWLWP